MKHPPFSVVRTHHRRAVLRPVLWIAVTGLAVSLLFAFDPDRLFPWACTLAITGLLALLVRLRQRQAHHHTARLLDDSLDAKNRLEASAELGHRTDPLAAAHQEETAAFLVRRPPPSSPGWIVGLTLFVLLLLVQLGSFGIAGFRLLAAPKPASASTTPTTAVPAGPPPATLTWKTPRPEITATQLEEVPLAAEAESATGLTHLVLHVTLNGEDRPAIPLSAAVATGKQTVPLSLYLDELAPQPYDIVAYSLTAERVAPTGSAAPKPAWPAISSPLQFVQIRPLRDDLQLGPKGGGSGSPAEKFLELVKRLKLAQLNLLKDAFALDHDQPPRTQSDWSGLVQSAGAEQTVIAEKTASTLAFGQEQGAPAEGIDLLTQARTEMDAAATALARPDPTTALPPAGRALARLTAVEKLYTKILSQGGKGKPVPKAPDPFAVDQRPKLPPRENTPAGQLEKLAADQAKLAEDLAQGPSEAGQGKGQAAKESQLARDLEKLAAQAALPAETNEAVKSAAASANEAAAQLAAEDSGAAAEPAARAAQQLRAAVAALEAAGRNQAEAALAAAQQSLNQSSGDLQGSSPGESGQTAAAQAAQNTAATRDALRDAAAEQQQKGSAEAAQKLESLAKAIADSKVQADLKKLAESAETDPAVTVKKLNALAQKAADAQGQLGDPKELQAHALEELKRARANLDRAAQAGPEPMRDLYEHVLHQAQLVAATLGTPGSGGGHEGTPAGSILASLTAPPSPEKNIPLKDYAATLVPPIDALITLLTAEALATADRPQVLTTANANEAPPAYRPAVSSYFESLARTKPKPVQP
ncbi:MAG: YlbF family regulator [Verrucomicrobia bacterium]|nr:YlbF family regulator [Verrucomicrobiota bacterium]